MRLRVREIKLPLDHEEDRLLAAVARRLGVSRGKITDLKLVKKAVDARRKTVCFAYTVDVELDDHLKLDAKALKTASLARHLFPKPWSYSGI